MGTWSDIPHWSKKALDQHGKKKGRTLEQILKEEEKETKVFIRYNTWQRNNLNVARHMVEKHLKRAVDTNPERVPSRITELLETELVNTEDSVGKEDNKRRRQQEDQIQHLTGKVDNVYQPGYPQIVA